MNRPFNKILPLALIISIAMLASITQAQPVDGPSPGTSPGSPPGPAGDVDPIADAENPPPPDNDRPHRMEGDRRMDRQGSWRDRDGDRPDRPDAPRPGPRHIGDNSPRLDRPLGNLEVEELMAMLKTISPMSAERMENLRRTSPLQFQEVLRRMSPHLWPLIEMKAREPKLFELTLAERRLSYRKYELIRKRRDASPEEIEKINDQLRQVIGDRYDVRQKILAYEIEAMSKKLEALKQKLNDQKARRDQMVEQEFDEIGKRRIGDRGPRDNHADQRQGDNSK